MTDQALNGKWQVDLSVAGGVAGATPVGTYLLIEGGYFERNTPDYVFTRTLTINNDTLPHQVDLHITNEPGIGKIFLGIYKIEGDTLYIAHSLPGRPRPVIFESTPENQQILSVSTKV